MKQESLKAKIKERYGKIALDGNSEGCCGPDCCNSTESNPELSSVAIGYDGKALESIPKSSILGLGCGAPINYANLKTGEIVVDLGSGAGIDAFLASRQVKDSGKVIGIDFTDEMLRKATSAAIENRFINVEFRKGDIEDTIPVNDNSVDVAISNCVINLSTDKVKTFKEVHGESVNADDWCSCIDGALTEENYINCIKEAGFHNVRVLNEQLYMNEDKTDGRNITSIIVGAMTK